MPEKYYSDENVTLYHGDCLEIREWLDADVLVTDPRYGMAYVSGHSPTRRPVAGDDSVAVRDAALDAWGGRAAIVFGRWNIERPKDVRARLIWAKGASAGMGDLTLPWGPAEEEIYIFGEGFIGRREPNVITVQMLMSSDRDRPDHPTPKPVPLMERLIVKCPPGVIADPFAGSGSTLVAAVNQGRKAIGVELDERYCELIAKRLSNQTMTLDFGSTS